MLTTGSFTKALGGGKKTKKPKSLADAVKLPKKK